MPPRTELDRSVQSSLLDRLTDTEPARAVDPATTFDASARAFRESVQRDVEWLLNTRRSIVSVPERLAFLRDSVFEFGIPDTTGLAVGTPDGRKALQGMLQEALERFEPRLAEPRVRLIDTSTGNVPQIRFAVEAILRMDPSPERVVFDTVLEMASGVYDVGADSASAR
ncbi:MAG: type VI secretion system baseplate subunit TssE [Gemmatirosa sp.]